jgi:hypothetical protein
MNAGRSEEALRRRNFRERPVCPYVSRLSLRFSGIHDLVELLAAGSQVKVRVTAKGQPDIEFDALVRIDTPQEALY